MIKNQKAAKRIMTLFSFTLIGFMMIISLLTFTSSKSFIETSTRDKAIQILSQTCSQAEDSLYAINQSTKLLMSETSLMQVLEYENFYSSRSYNEKDQIVSALNDFVFLNKNIRGAYIFDYLGNVYSTRSYLGSYTLEDFKAAARSSSGNLVWMGKNTMGELVICKELYSITLKPIGVLVIHMDDTAFSDVFQWQTEELHSMVSILDKNSGLVIYSSHQDASAASLSLLNQSEGNHPLQTTLKINRRKFSFYRYDSENNEFAYFYYVPTEYFTRGLSQTFYIILFITLLFFILLFLLYCYVKHTIQNPLGKIMRCVNQFALEGDIPQADFYYNDEFRELYLHFTDMGKRIQHLVADTYELEILNRNQELKILQAQINPHFVYNTLELINSIAANHGINQICRLSKSLSNILRYTIDNHQDEVPLTQELHHINGYIQIQKERFMGELTYTEEVEESVLQLSIMKLTLQPIIENCFNHGFQGKWEDCRIHLNAHREPGGFRVTIKDNGIGFTPENISAVFSDTKVTTEGNGIALQNIHKRLHLKYGAVSGLQIQSAPGEGTCISIYVERNLPCFD